MNIGFTGTRQGMTYPQAAGVSKLLSRWCNVQGTHYLHHGDCIGADLEAHLIANRLRAFGFLILIDVHPPDNPQYRAFCKSPVVHPQKPYLDRNRDIVEIADRVIATPGGEEQMRGSGTWYTIRYARATETPLWIVDRKGAIIHNG